MSCRKRKSEQDVFIGQRGGKRSRLHIVSHKNDVFCPVRPQCVQNGIELRIAQNDKDYIVLRIRRKLGHDRNAADRRAKRKLVFDPQSVLPDFLRPLSPRKQGDILSGAEQISCQIAAQHARAVYQNLHRFPPNRIFTICIFIPWSPTFARKRKKPLTDGSRRSL